MKVFQFHSFYADYLSRFYGKNPQILKATYAETISALLADRYHSIHILSPVYSKSTNARFTVGNDKILQEKWAVEHGLKSRQLSDILLAQIEEFRPDVVYSLDPVRFGSTFLRRLPGCVKLTVCWFAAMGRHEGVAAHNLRICNFPSFLKEWHSVGLRSAYFSPSWDPVMPRRDFGLRPIDVSFVGQYSHYHKKRNKILEEVCEAFPDRTLRFALLHPRWRRISERRFLNRIPTFIPSLPKKLRRVSTDPVYGVDLYNLFSESKIVLNAAIDLAGDDRGNMRCFEAMGCGAALLSDDGVYPGEMPAGKVLRCFRSSEDAISAIREMLDNSSVTAELAENGLDCMKRHFSKDDQWAKFQDICATYL